MSEDQVIHGLEDDEDDYTRREEPPWGREEEGPAPDEVAKTMEFETDFLEGTSSEDIRKQSFRNIPEGPHEVEVLRVEGFPKLTTRKVFMVQGDQIREDYFDAAQAQVIFCLPGDDNCQVRGFFYLTPPNRDQRIAYENGFSSMKAAKKSKTGGGGGFHARTLKLFLAAIGFQVDSKGRFEPAASRLANWWFYPDGRRRRCRLVVDPARMLPPKRNPDTGEEMPAKMGFPSIHMYSYDSPGKAQLNVPPPSATVPVAAQTEAQTNVEPPQPKGSKRSKVNV